MTTIKGFVWKDNVLYYKGDLVLEVAEKDGRLIVSVFASKKFDLQVFKEVTP